MNIEHNGKQYRIMHVLTLPERQTIEYYNKRFEQEMIDEFEFMDVLLHTISLVVDIPKQELNALSVESAVELGCKAEMAGLKS